MTSVRIESQSCRTMSITAYWSRLFALTSITDYYPLERESWWRMELDCPVIQSVSQVRVARDAREAYLDMVKEVRETDPVMADELLRWPAGFARVEERSLRRRSSEK